MTHTLQTTDMIHGDRRQDRRYPLDLELRYKVARGKQVLQSGAGRTTDLSSRGVAFETEQPLPLRYTAELWVDWPITLNGCPLRLIIWGRVVRSDRQGVAVRILKHEFRIAGSKPAAMERGTAGGRLLGQPRSPARGIDSRVALPRLPM